MRTIRNKRGITGLETAIILIAFVVVASVFAFTVLSTGLFAREVEEDQVVAEVEEEWTTITVIAEPAEAGKTGFFTFPISEEAIEYTERVDMRYNSVEFRLHGSLYETAWTEEGVGLIIFYVEPPLNAEVTVTYRVSSA